MKIEHGIVKDVDFNSPEGKEIYWHSTAHILATAVKRLYPNTKVTIGPAIDDGFYYDFDFGPDVAVNEEALEKISDEIRKVIKADLPFKREEVTRSKALEIFKNEPYKLELIKEISEGEPLSIYHLGSEFIDFCRGPHVESSGKISAVKLLKIAGAYWRGNEANKMLTRIYGISFPSKDELKTYLQFLEEAKARDHRKIGKKLDLFVFSELVGPGLPLYCPNGYILRNEIVCFSRELQNKIGYTEVHTPQFNKAELFKVSGHYDKYKEDMFRVKSNYTDEEYFLKPMNCPHHTQIYASRSRSYRDLPVRLSDFAMLYRDEKPGELSGLTRLRAFAQDDAHCFCTPEQIETEFKNVLGIIRKALDTYGLTYWVRLSLRDPKNKQKYLGEDEVWNKAESMMRQILKDEKVDFKEAEGEAAFYGPKTDIMIKDALGREWQVSTIQLDFNMPVRFGLKYIDSDNSEKNPIMIHRAVIGSPDRFLGILVEHFAGKFPLWLNPKQVVVVPVAEAFNKYAEEVGEKLNDAGIRVDVDIRDNSMNKKIREAEQLYVNYIIIVGEKEQSNKSINVRVRDTKQQKDILLEEFVKVVRAEKENRLLKSALQ